MTLLSLVTLLVMCFPYSYSVLDQGKWDFSFSQKSVGITCSLFAGSNIIVRISCDSHEGSVDVKVVLRNIPCLNTITYAGTLGQIQSTMNLKDSVLYKQYNCSDQIVPYNIALLDENEKVKVIPKNATYGKKSGSTVYQTTEDGIYLLIVGLRSKSGNGTVHIEIKGPHGGYLTAVEYPLLPFYAVMCLVYVLYCLIWLTISFLQWRDLLRIQFWIGGVILIGLIEKASFYEEFLSTDTTGEPSSLPTVLAVELVSVAKRTLARILVVIVSLGYGIVKPRLGSHFQKIIAVGVIYFTLASIEAYLRVTGLKKQPSEYLLLASIPLAVVDTLISWWIFSSLLQTTRTLRLRRNVVKTQLYNRFTNTLIFAVIVSTIFMLYSIKMHHMSSCLNDWSLLWLDDAFWHMLFSIVLLVIMILWRPTNNNQMYAFSPLLDAPDDEDDDEEVEHFVNDAYGVKMRGVGSNRSESPKQKNSLDDDLKWVEENIPTALIDTTLPVLDSDEELMNTRFEISKME